MKLEPLSHIYMRIMTFYLLMLMLAHFTNPILVFFTWPIPAQKIPPHNVKWVINYLSLNNLISHNNKKQISSYPLSYFHEAISTLYFQYEFILQFINLIHVLSISHWVQILFFFFFFFLSASCSLEPKLLNFLSTATVVAWTTSSLLLTSVKLIFVVAMEWNRE